MSTVYDLIRTAASSRPRGRFLLGTAGDGLSFGDLHDQVLETAGRLGALGVGRGDRVALLAPPTPASAAAILSISSVATCAPLDPSAPAPALRERLETLDPRLVVAPEGRAAGKVAAMGWATAVLRESGEFGRFRIDGPPGPDGASGFSPPGEDDAALALFTSGSTGVPKGVPLAHGNLAAAARTVARSLELGPEDRALHLLGLSHAHGVVSLLLLPLASTGGLCLAGPFEPDRFLSALETVRPTWYSAPPPLHRTILELIEDHPDRENLTQSLRFFRSGAAPLDPSLAVRLASVLGATGIEAYGLTEAPLVSGNPLAAPRPGSVGVSMGPRITVLDEGGRSVPPGITGEVALRGTGVSVGYLPGPGDPDVSREAGWFRTGDLGRLDGDGYLYITGRLGDVVNRGGRKAVPTRIERALASHPAVAVAVAFPVPHPTLGEDVAAAVVVRDGADPPGEGTLRDWAAARLERHEVPTRVLVVGAVPHSSSGKVKRRALAERFRSLLHRPFEPPDAQAESRVAEAFGAVLEIERVGRHDNFFTLGGDSLRAAAAAARLGGVAVSTIFRHPTPAELAPHLRSDGSDAGSSLRAFLSDPDGRA